MKDTTIRLAIAALAVIAPLLDAQEIPDSSLTRIERIQSKSGQVVILGYSSILSVAQMLTGDVLRVDEVKGIAGPETMRGIRVEISSKLRVYESFVDFEKLADLVQGITTILETNDNPTDLESYKIGVSDPGGFSVFFTSAARGNCSTQACYSVSAGRTLRETIVVSKKDIIRLRDGLLKVANSK